MNTTLQIGCMRSSGFENICYPSRNVCQPDMGHSLLMTRHRNGQSATEADSERFAEPSWGEIHNTTLEHFTRMWHGTFLVNCFRATMRFYNSLIKCNSLLIKKVLHTDISLSSRADSCWTSHLLTALGGLAHSDLMRRQVLACDPVNLS
eukprot:947726-Pelagomonas_calceolata.AAC.1